MWHRGASLAHTSPAVTSPAAAVQSYLPAPAEAAANPADWRAPAPPPSSVVTQGYLTATAAWRRRSRCAQCRLPPKLLSWKALRFVALMIIFSWTSKSYLIRHSGVVSRFSE